MTGERSSEIPRVSVLQWALSGACLALALSVQFLPTTVTLRDIVLLIVGLHLLLLAVLGIEAIRTRVAGKLLLAGGTLVFFLLEAAAAALASTPFSIPENFTLSGFQFELAKVSLALLYITLFQFMLFVGYSIRPRLAGLTRFVINREDRHTPRATFLKYLLAGCIWVPLIASFGLNRQFLFDVIVASRTDIGGTSTATIGYLHYLTFFGMFGGALLLVDAVIFAPAKSRLFVFAAAAAVIVPMVMLGGSRNIWLTVALPTVLTGLAWSAQKWGVKKVAQLGLAVIAIFVVVSLQFQLRLEGWNKIGAVNPRTLISGGTENGQFDALMFALYFVPGRHPYFYEPAEPYFAIQPIPSLIWEGKPAMRSWRAYNEAYPKIGAFNVTPSVIGQFHINWGWPGVVFIGLWLGFLTNVADRLLKVLNHERQRVMAVTIGFFFAFIINSFRFYSPVWFTYFMIATLGMLFLTRVRPEAAKGVVEPAPGEFGALPSGSSVLAMK